MAEDSTSEDRTDGDAAAGDTLSYEQARDELADVVRRLEAGGLTLEESLSLWERGERLAGVCEGWLEGARARLAAAMAERTAPGGDAEAPF
ncbi:MAG: exodeoxyribonuclease VII small subunit [Actinomadura sp.]